MRRLPDPVAEFLLFGLKMAWSCLFGAAMLALLILSRWLWPPDAWLHRYDLLLILALLIISFVCVILVIRPRPPEAAPRS